ncbi:diguanylate cyclase [Dokdonella sp.]|uniref:diguanylate cyclase n=1 Tax=Dokdonella sp. TaxID=2291710 RepID=UPI003C3E6ED4
MNFKSSTARMLNAPRLPRQIYIPRVLGLGLGALVIGAALHDQARPTWVWMLTLIGGFAWPHLAYLHSSRAGKSGRAEKINLMIDAALTSFALYAIGFSIVPSAIGITLLAMNNLSVGGVGLLAKGCIAIVAGLVVGAVFLPFEFHPASSLLVQSATMLLVVLYLTAFAWTMWRMANDLQQSRDALHMLSQTDALSGLKNRGAFESALGEKFAALRSGHGNAGAALLFLDMDHFKQINDESGHAAGDGVLRAMGSALNFEIRKADIAARYGGDEFAVLLDQADEPAAHVFLDRVKNRIRATAVFENSAVPLTWSTGVSIFDASVSSPDAWLAQADAALYKVKQRERGGVVLAQSEHKA